MTFLACVTMISAGSTPFGENTLSAQLGSKKLDGPMLVPGDQNAQTLDTIKRTTLLSNSGRCLQK
jgi:hypothetical protein